MWTASPSAGLAALAAALVPFGEAEKHLLTMAGLHVDDKRIHRLVQRLGPSATRLLEADPEVLTAPQRLRPPRHRSRYAGVDGGRIRLRGGAWKRGGNGKGAGISGRGSREGNASAVTGRG